MFNGSIDLRLGLGGRLQLLSGKKISLCFSFFSFFNFHLILYFEFYLSLHYSMYETTVYYIIHAKFMVNFIIDVP